MYIKRLVNLLMHCSQLINIYAVVKSFFMCAYIWSISNI